MSKTQNRLEELQPYVIGIRFSQGLPVIDVIFKEKWTVPDSTIIHKEKVDGNDNYYMFFSEKEGIGMDELLDYAEGIIQMNIEKEKKNELFKVKLKELQQVFSKNSLDSLENMKFVLGSKSITADVDFDEVNFDDEIEVEIPTKVEEKVVEEKVVEEKVVEEPKLEMVVAEGGNVTTTTTTTTFGDVELPPKGGKIELENHDLPPDAYDGACTCGPDEACPKCIDNK